MSVLSKRDKARELLQGSELKVQLIKEEVRSESLDRQQSLTVDLTLLTDIFPYLG